MRFLNFYLLTLMLLVAVPMAAQYNENPETPTATMESQKFRFIYIAPDNLMSQKGLIEAIVDHHNHIIAEESPAIFYLSHQPEPIVVKLNTGAGDNPDDFESELLYALRQSMAYSVTPDVDRDNIMKILQENDFVDENDNVIHDNIEFDFHVGKSFWDAGNNETILAAIYFNIDAKKYIDKNKMQFNVIFRCPPSKGTLNRESPFGIMNLDDINTIVIPRVQD